MYLELSYAQEQQYVDLEEIVGNIEKDKEALVKCCMEEIGISITVDDVKLVLDTYYS